MTGDEPKTQWWIAREDQQHGPLSDAEMRAFIEMRHLRPTDLVWRPGFVDWRPAQLIFPMESHDAPPENLQAMVAAPISDDHGSSARAAREAADRARAGTRQAAGAVHRWLAHAAKGTARLKEAARSKASARAPNSIAERRFRRDRSAARRVPIVRAAMIAALTCVVLAAGWLLVANRETVMRMAGLGGSAFNAAATGSAAANTAPGKLDARLQRMPLWVAVKKEFPSWYGDLMAKTASLATEEEPSTTLSKQLAEALVALRRQHANAALAASPARLRGIAEAFLENLRVLKAQGTDACYAFISQGETSPATVELLGMGEDGRHLQNQVAAIVAAIAEGRSSPVSHQKPNKADYDKLAGGLMKLGWSEDDLKLFANPRALANSKPEKVCQMVHDWFLAHIAIEDASTQERLLVETLRPVVSG